jgi:hypothetical protein
MFMVRATSLPGPTSQDMGYFLKPFGGNLGKKRLQWDKGKRTYELLLSQPAQCCFRKDLAHFKLFGLIKAKTHSF